VVTPEIAPFDPPTSKTHRRTKHEVDRTTPRGDGHLKFSKCEVVGRSSVAVSLVAGRRSPVGPQYILLTLGEVKFR